MRKVEKITRENEKLKEENKRLQTQLIQQLQLQVPLLKHGVFDYLSPHVGTREATQCDEGEGGAPGSQQLLC